MNNINPNVPPAPTGPAQPNFAPPVYTPPAPVPKRDYTPLESVFAWLSLLAGYLFCRILPVGAHPLGGFLFIIAMFLATAISLKCKGVKMGALPIIAALSAVAVSGALILSSNSFLHFFAYAYALCAYGYFLYAAAGNRLEKGLSDLLPIDYLKALVVLPFASFGELFRAMFSGKAQRSGRLIGKILLGILLTAIPTTLVLVLLSYDRDFWILLSNIFDFDVVDIFSHLISLAFGIPVGMYVFGLFVSSVDRKCADTMTAQSCRAAYGKIKIAPTATVLAATLPVLCIYVLFFISQWKYYISAFTGLLPEGFSHAEYARDGFFQLCTVSVINLLMILTVVLFMRRKDGRPPVVQKILAVIFSAFTLILIATAIAKMVLYIDQFGLTQKRVYATWLMVVLAVVFILIALRQFIAKMPAVAVSVWVCVAMFALLALSNVDGIIARYNVDRYLDGSLDTVDVYAMEELGDAAIPELARLYEVLDEKSESDSAAMTLKTEVYETLEREAEWREMDDSGLFSATLPAIKAENALREMGLME